MDEIGPVGCVGFMLGGTERKELRLVRRIGEMHQLREMICTLAVREKRKTKLCENCRIGSSLVFSWLEIFAFTALVQFPVRELRYCKPHGMVKK